MSRRSGSPCAGNSNARKKEKSYKAHFNPDWELNLAACVSVQITFLMRKFRNVERNLQCDVVHVNTKWLSSLDLDCNDVFAIKAYCTAGGFLQMIRCG